MPIRGDFAEDDQNRAEVTREVTKRAKMHQGRQENTAPEAPDFVLENSTERRTRSGFPRFAANSETVTPTGLGCKTNGPAVKQTGPP
eukprot:gene18359-biopygen2405